MTYTTEHFVRLEVGKLLRVEYQGKGLCSACLVRFVSAAFGTAHTKAQIRKAMRGMFAAPGALTRIPTTFPCGECGKLRPCLKA